MHTEKKCSLNSQADKKKGQIEKAVQINKKSIKLAAFVLI